MTNHEIAEVLSRMAEYYEIEKDRFRARAYERASDSVSGMDNKLADIYREKGLKGLLDIPGVGQGIAGHIEELMKTGRLEQLSKFEKHLPIDIAGLTRISGIGPLTAKTLYEKLGVKNVTDLKKAVLAGKIRKVPGFGEKSEEAILKALEFQNQHSGRYSLLETYPIVEDLKARLGSSGMFKRIEFGGSYRRRQDTMGDIDILATAKDSQKAMDFFTELPGAKVLEKGSTKSVIHLANGLEVDLRVIQEESWGAALQYFTGDKAHNVHMRKIAIAKGLKLSEYGLEEAQSAKHKAKNFTPNFSTEKEIYNALGMDWIPPELRTDTGEIEAAQAHKLPKLLEYGSVRGDLQVQTDWSDGANSVEEMAREAIKLGREYIAITDHTKALTMMGMDEKTLLRQMKEIDKINSKLKNQNSKFKILKGAEVNILKNGELDIEAKVLEKLDVVGISIHPQSKMSSADMTKRLTRALSNPLVNILFHPTTRLINKRPPIEFDFDAILKVAKKNRVALEVNSHPMRLDLRDVLIRKTIASGVKLVIDSDAHRIEELSYLHFGEAQARRGWAARDDVLNTEPVDELLKYFGRK